MIELLNDFPDSGIGVRAAGKVSRQDYEDVVVPAIEHMIESSGKINFLLLLDTPLSNYSVGADFKDILIGLQYYKHWRKIAIVSDEEYVRKFVVGINYPLPGETKAFTVSELEEAKSWVTT